MKNYVILLIVSFMSTTAMAQTAAGTFSVGGAISVSGNTYRSGGYEHKVSEFQFSPSLGYFVTDGLMVGAALGASLERDDWDAGLSRSSSLSLGPFLRYYKFTGNERFAFTGEAGFAFAGGRSRPNDGRTTKTGSFNMYVRPGFAYFPTQHWGIDLQVDLVSFTADDPNRDNDGDNTRSFYFGLSTFNPWLSVRYFF